MSSVVIRNLSEETHRALKARAARHGRSTEAEIRIILEETTRSAQKIRLGTLLASIGREASVTEQDVTTLQQVRDKTPVNPLVFE